MEKSITEVKTCMRMRDFIALVSKFLSPIYSRKAYQGVLSFFCQGALDILIHNITKFNRMHNSKNLLDD